MNEQDKQEWQEAVVIDPLKLLVYWVIVLIPLAYGIINTFIKSLPLFYSIGV